MHVTRKAEIFATAAHAAIGQVRKYTGEPYIVHPREVAALVARFGGDDSMIAAAWLHDVVEDTNVSLDCIRKFFDDNVADLVYWLTDISKPQDGNRETRKAIDRAHIAAAPARAQTIKCCDLICNTKSIAENDISFAKVYLAEKYALLDVMTQADRSVHFLARETARSAQKTVDAAGA